MKKTLLTVFGFLSCIVAMAQWSDDPDVNNRITPDDYLFYDCGFATTKDGLSYVVFEKPITTDELSGTATFLQIITKDGVKLFPDEGKLISHYRTLTYTMINSLVFADNDGNALIFVSDLRHSSASDLSYTVYKVSPTGELLWGANGVDLGRGVTSSIEAGIKAIQLEDGSYILAWQRLNNDHAVMGVVIERLSKDGELLWETPLEIKGTTENSYPKLVNAGNNQFILVYIKGSSRALTARKIDFDGESVWSEEVCVYRGSYTIPALESVFDVTSDNQGGVFVNWYDDRSNTKKESAYVSYVKSNGQFGFSTTDNSGEVRVGYANFRQFASRTAYDQASNSLYVVWRESNAGESYRRFVIQKLAITGELLWDPDGIQIVEADHPESLGYYTIQNAGAGKFAVFYMYSYYPYRDTYSIAALLDGETGESLWTIPFATYLPNQASSKGNKDSLVSSLLIKNKYWLTLWTDYRESSDLYHGSLYIQRVNLDGTLGSQEEDETAIQIPAMKNNDFTVTPSLIKETALFTVNNPQAGNVNISLYSAAGQKVATVYDGQLNAGTHTLPWNAKTAHLGSGIYIVKLITTEGNKSTHIIIK
jgi:hypothetical protein